jgi:phage terminase large subunit
MPIVADSAEPKSIEDLRRAGFNIEGANKGADSIRNSIDTLKQFKLNISRQSVNTIKEFRSYKWVEGKSNIPVDFNNHSIDAIRYVALNRINKNTGRYSFA